MDRVPISLSNKWDICSVTELGKTGGNDDTKEEQGSMIRRGDDRKGPEEETKDQKGDRGSKIDGERAKQT